MSRKPYTLSSVLDLLRIALTVASFCTMTFLDAETLTVGNATDFTQEADFSALRAGSNIRISREYEKGETAVLKLVFEKKQIDDENPEHNWFTLKQPIAPDSGFADADGLEVKLSLAAGRRWWFGLAVTTEDGNEYHYSPLLPMDYDVEVEERIVRFEQFKSKDGQVLDPSSIRAVTLSGTGNVGIVYLRDISFFSEVVSPELLSFAAESRYGGHIFERGEPVELGFGLLYEQTAGDTFAYEVTDYEQKIVARGEFRVRADTTNYHIPLDVSAPGYYEVRAFPVNEDGMKSEVSCLRQMGSIPGAFGTFSIMPHSVEENITRMLDVGEKAFFGLHNIRRENNLQELMGFPWMFKYARWEHIEKENPMRSHPEGTAAWVDERLAETGPFPPYLFSHTSLLAAQTGEPKWASSDDPTTPPHYRNEEEMMSYVRDYIRYHKKLFPHMEQRTYEILWEPENYTAGYLTGNHKIVYPSQDAFIPIMEKISALVKEEDPDALVLGPTSMKHDDMVWYEDFFKKGFLDYADAFSGHFYVAAPPESGHLPEYLVRMHQLIQRYAGHDMDIYNTEAGFKSQVGTQHKLREHAGWLTRYTMILKGEGVKRHLVFYPTDIGSDPTDGSTYGLCFYSGEKDAFSFKTQEFSPKPAVVALATCSSQLLGAKPVRHIRDWGQQIWGYVFERKGEPVLAIWSPFKSFERRVVVGNVDSIRVTDIMGRHRQLAAVDGYVSLQLGPDPLYLEGLDAAIYLGQELTGAPTLTSQLPVVTPGKAREFSLVESESNQSLASVLAWGDDLLAEKLGEHAFRVSAPVDSPEMSAPVMLYFEDGSSAVQWVNIGPSLSLKNVQVASEKGVIGLRLEIKNYTESLRSIQLRMTSEFSPETQLMELEIPSEQEVKTFMPFGGAASLVGESSKPLSVDLQLIDPLGETLEEHLELYILSAYQDAASENVSASKLFPDEVEIHGSGSSGQKDSARIAFTWDALVLGIEVAVQDDIFSQGQADDRLWAEDSLQIAFDTDPQLREVYNPMQGIFNKKITELTLAKTSDGFSIVREITHNGEELALGRLKSSEDYLTVRRDENAKVTYYQIRLPWSEIGISSVQQGKGIGLSILVNDSDGPVSPRKSYALFGGIVRGKNYHEYGRLTLR